MPEWVEPDRLDRISSGGNPGTSSAQASRDDVARALKRALVTGGLRRVPKHPQHRDIVLAMLCLNLRRRHPYKEPELNENLRGSLEAMHASVDHVTCRRYLVDLGFLKRDRSGSRYLLNYPKVESTISNEALNCAWTMLRQVLQRNFLAATRRGST